WSIRRNAVASASLWQCIDPGLGRTATILVREALRIEQIHIRTESLLQTGALTQDIRDRQWHLLPFAVFPGAQKPTNLRQIKLSGGGGFVSMKAPHRNPLSVPLGRSYRLLSINCA